jgi:hypothetical protein
LWEGRSAAIDLAQSSINLKVPPNIFAPTIEDDAGVFYQAANSIHSGSVLALGGLYVKKEKLTDVLFFGNAQGSGDTLRSTRSPSPRKSSASCASRRCRSDLGWFPRSNQLMQLTASKPDVCASGYLPLWRYPQGMRRGLASVDLVSC